ncbi:cyclin-U2-1-like [Macadamia integrifolia]|uniref:cyclin-U2-1-like n=1 Tax=Macadamia integrifolia TaxID=60698 RepID=UPI001C4E32E1|nr:cyclin-U2-1-like [Macadamia integrifolia]
MGSSPTPISPRKLRSDLYSFSYEDDSNTPLVISVLASLLERTIARNERITRKRTWALSKDAPTHIFNCSEVLDMTIQSFLERIFRYTRVGPPVYVVAYVYIDRLCQILSEFQITYRNVQRLLITTIMVASKFVEDRNYRNSYFAKVGGLTRKEMNKLEIDFLFLMGFKLHVNVSVFESYCCHLEREVSLGGGYQIERTLWFMCGGEMKSRQREENDFLDVVHVRRSFPSLYL